MNITKIIGNFSYSFSGFYIYNDISGILNYIKQRKFDTFFELEEKIMSKANVDKVLLDILSDPETGTPEDKMRLFIIYYICTPYMSDADYTKYESVLQSSGCDLLPLIYIKRWKYVNIINCLVYI